jgi:hypothetical protein
MPPQGEHTEILQLLRENRELVEQNNVLLKKLYRHNMIGFTIRIVWILVLVGLPFALYFTILEPYFQALGSDYDTFQAGVGEIPGLKALRAYYTP